MNKDVVISLVVLEVVTVSAIDNIVLSTFLVAAARWIYFYLLELMCQLG